MMPHVHTMPVRPEHEDEPWRTWDELVNVGVLVPPVPDGCKWMNVVCDDPCPLEDS